MVSLLTVHTSPIVSLACGTGSTAIADCFAGATLSDGCSADATDRADCSAGVTVRAAESVAVTANLDVGTGVMEKLRQFMALCFYEFAQCLHSDILAHAVVGVGIDDICRSYNAHV